MKFSDTRQPVAKVDEADQMRPAHNRASRRAAGRYRGHRRSALRRVIRNAHFRPGQPWRPVVDAEIVE